MLGEGHVHLFLEHALPGWQVQRGQGVFNLIVVGGLGDPPLPVGSRQSVIKVQQQFFVEVGSEDSLLGCGLEVSEVAVDAVDESEVAPEGVAQGCINLLGNLLVYTKQTHKVVHILSHHVCVEQGAVLLYYLTQSDVGALHEIVNQLLVLSAFVFGDPFVLVLANESRVVGTQHEVALGVGPNLEILRVVGHGDCTHILGHPRVRVGYLRGL